MNITIEEPLALEPGPTPRPGRIRQRYEDMLQRHHRRAASGHGFWGERPAGLSTLKEYTAYKADQCNAGLAKAGVYVHGWLVALPVCSAVYGLLWLLGKPVYTSKWDGGPPPLSQVRSDIRSRGTVGRIYGYAVVGPAHALGYLVAGIFQRPQDLFNALIWAIAILIVIK